MFADIVQGKTTYNYLVGGLEHFLFSNISDNPSYWLIFVKMVKTTNQYNYNISN